MKSHSEKELKEGFARLLAAAEGTPNAPCELRHPERLPENAEVGDVWAVGAGSPPCSSAEAEGADALEEEDRLWMVLVEPAQVRYANAAVWRAVPAFAEIEHATDDDAVLPRRAMGGRVGLAFGCEAPVPATSFRRLVGQLSSSWIEAVLDFRAALERGEEPVLAKGMQTGIPATHPLDPAIRFHEDLVASLEPVMRPVLEEALAGARAMEDVIAPALAGAPLPAGDWLREQWRRVRAAAENAVEETAEDFAAWARPLLAALAPPPPAPAGFRADDGATAGEPVAVELRVPSVGALILVAREASARSDWRAQVLEDRDNALEGAEILDTEGRVLTTITGGAADQPFAAEGGAILLRLPDGELAELVAESCA